MYFEILITVGFKMLVYFMYFETLITVDESWFYFLIIYRVSIVYK